MKPLVTTSWAADHLEDPGVRIIESNEDVLLYRSGHIPGAVEVDWVRDLNDPLIRDYLSPAAFSKLCSGIGVTPETMLVFYGDRSNWWACYAFWVFSLFGHKHLAVMDGGRLKWEQEGRPLSKEKVQCPATVYPQPVRNDHRERAFRDEVSAHLKAKRPLVDVRSPAEFSGERLHMEEYPNEGALRGGHIPGAKNVPWGKAVNPVDGTFLPEAGLLKLYCAETGLKPDDEVIAYCRIGERSSHTWFVLRHLLQFPTVRNYDGSWTEWGNLVGAPVEK